MSAKSTGYTRLSGRGMRTRGNWVISVSRSVCELWQGSDHLLLVDRKGYVETYKRFYYRDIQAIVIRKTGKAIVLGIILGLLTAICVLWGISVTEIAGRMTLWIFALIFGIPFLVNLFRGPSCITHLKTAVQTEQLPPWNRLRAARKGIKRVRPLLMSAQGEISADELRVRLEDMVRRDAGNSAPSGI